MTQDFSNKSDRWDQNSPLVQAGGPASKAYDWRGRMTTWRGRLRTLRARLKAKAGLAAAGALAGGGVVSVALIANPDLIYARHKVEAPMERWGEAVVFAMDGFDLAGRKASFDLALMPKDYTWARGSSTELAFRGERLSEAEAIAKVFSGEVREGLGRSPEVIAVGAASQEGALENEQDRAERRAKSQAQLIAKSVSPLTKIWTLNLGRYSEACKSANTADTSWQRPVMFVGVRFQHPGVVLVQALENAISGKSNVPSRECYSSFDMAPSR